MDTSSALGAMEIRVGTVAVEGPVGESHCTSQRTTPTAGPGMSMEA